MANYRETQLRHITEGAQVSIKQIYGWVLYACILLLLLFLLYDAPVRRELKRIPQWKDVARQVKNSFWRTRHHPAEANDGRPSPPQA